MAPCTERHPLISAAAAIAMIVVDEFLTELYTIIKLGCVIKLCYHHLFAIVKHCSPPGRDSASSRSDDSWLEWVIVVTLCNQPYWSILVIINNFIHTSTIGTAMLVHLDHDRASKTRTNPHWHLLTIGFRLRTSWNSPFVIDFDLGPSTGCLTSMPLFAVADASRYADVADAYWQTCKQEMNHDTSSSGLTSFWIDQDLE